jgi:phosphoribosylaminoimidazolecarboxamide formyltransferase / IMP cyclohydrolase
MTEKTGIKRALISVSDKTGLIKLGQSLQDMGIEIISTGGTLKKLKEAGVQTIPVSGFTGSPEVLGGRVKTLHPKIHGSILYRRGDEKDEEQLSQIEGRAIDLIVVNLYPFEQTVAREDATREEVIENIDIGGPSLIRASAKNHEFVTIVTDPCDYDNLIEQLREHDGQTTPEFRRQCAAKAYALTARYDTAIADYFAAEMADQPAEGDALFPARLNLCYRRRENLRYGENPHQRAAVYEREGFPPGPSLLRGEILSGKELSYNNYGDLDAALDMILDFEKPFACVLKHANPCGAAQAETIAAAYKAAYDSDPLSAFGSIIGLNREVDMACAELLHETPFVECILAPGFTEEALALLKRKKNRRLLAVPQIADGVTPGQVVFKPVRGGLLYQQADEQDVSKDELKVVTKREPTPEELKALMFAWKVVKHTKSNAIVLAKGEATVGIGMGQTSRVDSGFMAVKRAGERAQGAVMASDAFFPMPDGVEVGTEAGVTAIIQPGGSKGDAETIAAADKAGAAMVFTGMRHFKH